MLKTQQEIIERYKQQSKQFMWIGGANFLLQTLTAQNAKQFLKDNADLSKWEQIIPTKDYIIEQIANYVPFAIDKIDNHRGLSTNRSIQHMAEWLWFLGDSETLTFAEDEGNYQNYGAPVLAEICKKYNIEAPTEEWFLNMASGQPCGRKWCDGCSK